ncbi:MAG: GNAT family N-acetyltransferase [Flavobacteriales bacterium]|nr:GNAT family N-acetyltransferase [Flavobacteriales bacterium]
MAIKHPVPSMEGVHTERLRFRRPVLEDSAWWMEYLKSSEAIRFMPFTVGREADCAAFIQRSLDRFVHDGSGLNAVVRLDDERPVGMIGLLTQVVDGLPELEIGYHLLPSAWGNGYATESAVACREFARLHQVSPTVISLIDADNLKSQAVAKRNGMSVEKRTIHRGVEALVFRAMLMSGI